MEKKPNLFIVGTQKAASTSLYNYLKEHPDIFMSEVKEPRYFNYEYDSERHEGHKDDIHDSTRIKSFNEYRNLFSDVQNEKVIGEASIEYMYYPEVAQKIYNFNSKSKIIIILRNPVDRAYSAYTHLKRDLREKRTFEEALQFETERVEKNYHQIWHYKKVGEYYNQIKSYYEVFGKNQVKVILDEDLKTDLYNTMNSLFNFLEVDEMEVFNHTNIYNASGIPKNLFLQKFIKKNTLVKKIVKNIVPIKIRYNLLEKLLQKNLEKIPMNITTRRYLINYFYNDIKHTENLINRDLSHWLK